MPIATRKQGKAVILDLDGRLALGTPVVEFTVGVSDALKAGAQVVIVNLQQVPMVDSSGIGAMLRCDAAATAARAKLKIVGANENVRHAFKLTRLDSVFEFHDSEESALK